MECKLYFALFCLFPKECTSFLLCRSFQGKGFKDLTAITFRQFSSQIFVMPFKKTEVLTHLLITKRKFSFRYHHLFLAESEKKNHCKNFKAL